MKRLLDQFVSARFWLLPTYVLAYYVQFYIEASNLPLKVLRGVLLAVLILLLVIAILANRMWTEHYRERVFSGLKFLIENDIYVNEKTVLEQHRWAGAELLGVVIIILTTLSHFPDLEQFGRVNSVPLLVTAMVILVALFDAALDLSAQQTISLLARTRKPEEQFAKVIYYTNQRDKTQQKLYQELVDEDSGLRKAISEGNSSYISNATFSSQAHNLIAMAIIIVFFVSAVAIFKLTKQFMELF